MTGALLCPQGFCADSRGGGGADPGAERGHRRERGRQVGAGGLPGAAAGRARCRELHPRARNLCSHRGHPTPSSQRTGDLSTPLSMLPSPAVLVTAASACHITAATHSSVDTFILGPTACWKGVGPEIGARKL